MKVVTVVKNGRGGNGASQATRYISERERDENREGKEPRKLFSGDKDDLNFYQANRLLGGDSEPRTNDVLHLVISFEKEEDFNQLGANEGSRQQGVRESTRGTMSEMTGLLNAEELRWVAGIHRNTDNPHVHLLIHRDYVDREAGRTRRLKTLPKEMRVGWEKSDDGERIIKPGRFNETFEKFLEQRVERMKQDEREERFLLGRALIAEDEIERLNKRLDDAIKYGEFYRYQFSDEIGRSRGFSEHDVNQRGRARAIQIMAHTQSDLTPEIRRQIRESIFADEFNRHRELISKHRGKRNKQISGIRDEIENKWEVTTPLIERVSAIKNHHESDGTPLPVPILSRDELGVLQNHAVETGDTARFRNLEDLRNALAAESDTPKRKDIEIGRLRAQLFVAQSSLTLEQETARRFEETKHLMRWESTGRFGGKTERGPSVKRSLAEVERMLAWETDQAKFFGARYLHWDGARRHEAQVRVEKLTHEREWLLDQIEARRTEISDETERKAELVTTLYEIFSKEERRYRNEGREVPGPLFSVQELKEIDNQALRRRDPEFYRELVEIERDLESHLDPRTEPKDLPTFEERVGRARARAFFAEIGLRESELNLERFNERREHTDVIVKDDGKRSITIARLADFEPRSPLEQLVRPLMIQDDKSHEVAAALEAYRAKLVEEHKTASANFNILLDEARRYEEEFTRQNPDDPLPRPQFTSFEISKLELHAAKETDLALKAKYEDLYFGALVVDDDDKEAKKIILKNSAQEILNPVSLHHQERINEMEYEYDYLHRPDRAQMNIER